jgi:hypothetical protein
MLYLAPRRRDLRGDMTLGAKSSDKAKSARNPLLDLFALGEGDGARAVGAGETVRAVAAGEDARTVLVFTGSAFFADATFSTFFGADLASRDGPGNHGRRRDVVF